MWWCYQNIRVQTYLTPKYLYENHYQASCQHSVIQTLIHKNQYGFIQSRTVQDCVAWALEYLHLCRKSNKQLLILKLDFEKAFDKVEHSAMLNIMQHRGFGPKWLQWMSMIFSSGTSSVLLNGVPRKVLHCRRGVRQGDCNEHGTIYAISSDFGDRMTTQHLD